MGAGTAVSYQLSAISFQFSVLAFQKMATKDGGTFVDVEILACAPTLEVRRVASS
ncbi:hypothetical protein SBA7_20008 [Candidatus Sulfotelmatobacter sp. SbA7]|nr:hypothetical protein SBA7_20008 [Candidatus Sulfotelmatobacter sp. SbA7]